MDKNSRKLNIMINGEDLKIDSGTKDVKDFLVEKIEVDVNIEEVVKIGTNKRNQTIIRAKVNSWENKEKIIKNKNKLKGTNYFIDPDFKEGEEKKLKRLREIAKPRKNRSSGISKKSESMEMDEIG